jgi:NRAMP (natural resistance-associated macrophage protein)-like metal ion transporter
MSATPSSRPFRQKLWLFLAVMGPGIITANVDNDAGGITTYSVAGAHFGLTLLWSLVPIMVALIVVQEMCARLGVVTGKGLSDLIREQFGVKVTFYVMVALILTNLGNAVAEFAGVAASMELFGVPRFVSVPIAAALVWGLVVKGTYASVEKIFLWACLFYVSYLLSGFMVHPQWSVPLSQLVTPTFRYDSNYLYMLIGVVGTTIAPWMQFYQQASVVEKGITVERYAYSRLDVIVGCVVVNVVAFFIIVTCAATLHTHGIRIESASQAAQALAPLAGKYCAYLFAFGLLNASLFAASILPLSTAYAVCEGMGWETGVNKKFFDAPQFYGLYTAIILIGMGVILLPGVPLIPIMLFSQVLNGVLLPFVLITMLQLTNNPKLMGKYVNGPFHNAVAWSTVAVVIGLSLLLVITSLF